MKNILRKVQAWRNRTTIRKQLSILIGLAVALTIALLIVFNYVTQTRANVQQQIEALTRVLELENRRLDDYLGELSTFSLQLRSNSGFMSTAAQTAPLDYMQKQDVETALKSAYYSRGDLIDAELYLVRQQQMYAIENRKRKISVTEGMDVQTLPDYARFTAKPAYYSVTPDSRGFLCFTRTIIDSPRETPLAVLRFTVSSTALDAIRRSHARAQEQLCLFDTSGERYYVAENLTEADTDALRKGMQTEGESFTVTMGNVPYLCVASKDSESGFVLVGFKPMAVVNAALIATRNGSIVIGLLALVLSVAVAEVFIRYTTEPLSKLAHRIRRVGTGNFKTKAALEGSYELIGLSEDVNHMMAGIDSLIERTYVATLNERTAQLVALEAQTNPHFLFNTLQAIGSEALVRGQTELYKMVTALGSLLRYSIKGGNLATLATEMGYVEKYLFLQKARFGERLTYRIHVEDTLQTLNVPKLGVLSLAENSIVHGLRDQVTNIHIELTASVEDAFACLVVSDDGCGIAPAKLEELRQALSDPAVSISQNVGLMNLASRLKLLYNGRAMISLTSDPEPRLTTVTLRIPLEVQNNV